MLVYGTDYPHMAPGLGLSNRILVAAHFEADQHLLLLRMAIATNPYLLGIGLPEQAAIIRRADRALEVVGLSDITIVDGSKMRSTNLADWQPGQPFQADGLTALTLAPDHRFDLETRQALPPELDLPYPRHSTL